VVGDPGAGLGAPGQPGQGRHGFALPFRHIGRIGAGGDDRPGDPANFPAVDRFFPFYLLKNVPRFRVAKATLNLGVHPGNSQRHQICDLLKG
jgi:hypothetical protein